MQKRFKELQQQYQQIQEQKLNLDLTRGKPSSAQLALSDALDGILENNYLCEDGSDCRNYGGGLGIPEARRLAAVTGRILCQACCRVCGQIVGQARLVHGHTRSLPPGSLCTPSPPSVESVDRPVLFSQMRMPYTEALLRSIPKLDEPRATKLAAIPGRPPSLVDPPTGCRFAPRCPYAQRQCHIEAPPLVESEPGSGSTFRVLLPHASDTVPDDEPKDVAPSDDGGSETVLLVEDETAVRRLGCRILERKGYRVLEADSGAAAIRLFEHMAPAITLLVTDVVMPGMSGSELARRLRSMKPSLRVLFTSGYTADAVQQQGGFEAGTAFLEKPFTPDVLAQKVRDVLDDRDS